MSDPRFARLKNDPRFRRPRKHQSKVVVDDRFKDVLEKGDKKGKKAGPSQVDKYGRKISKTQQNDDLRRFYRLEDDAEEDVPPSAPDLARGEVLMESSDEEDEEEDEISDSGGIVTFGEHKRKPSPSLDDDEDVEIDLDEDNFADLDAQAAAYDRDYEDEQDSEVTKTRRIAVVNLDWDHVRAAHLFKIFSSLVSPTAPLLPSSSEPAQNPKKNLKTTKSTISRGQVLSVRVYPSEFGKERMAREEREGPPAEVFKKQNTEDDEEINEKTIYEVNDGQDYDEDALRRYQLERLRYYYAIVTCDTVEAASHIFSELEGTELERSANVFDLSFVPDDMTFDDEPRDEVTEVSNGNYKGIDFVTDALRHSKVKLTWDEDDPERNQLTRRKLTKDEIDSADFKAYIASSDSESEVEESHTEKKSKKSKKASASRDKLRALLLDGNKDDLPEGWGDDGGDDVDMEITFGSGLSKSKNAEDETSLEKYQRKMKEKRKKRKDGVNAEQEKGKAEGRDNGVDEDEFFAVDDEDSDDHSGAAEKSSRRSHKDKKREGKVAKETDDGGGTRPVSTQDELALLVASENPDAEPKHFDLKSVIKAEKKNKRKGKAKKGKDAVDDSELQEDFVIDVKDDRFKAIHDDHTFAIDPTNPQFKKTKSMTSLLAERSKRQKHGHQDDVDHPKSTKTTNQDTQKSLNSLVESVKRKSAAMEHAGKGKRRRV